MNFPNNVKYTEEHEWIRVEGDIAYVGISDYAQEQLGDIVFVDITTEGETLEKGEVFGTIEVVKTISDLFLPVAGEVLEQNEALADNPELVNQDPYGKGWLVKIKPNDANDINDLMDAEAYKALVNEENTEEIFNGTYCKYYHGQHLRPSCHGKGCQATGRDARTFRDERSIGTPYTRSSGRVCQERCRSWH